MSGKQEPKEETPGVGGPDTTPSNTGEDVANPVESETTKPKPKLFNLGIRPKPRQPFQNFLLHYGPSSNPADGSTTQPASGSSSAVSNSQATTSQQPISNPAMMSSGSAGSSATATQSQAQTQTQTPTPTHKHTEGKDAPDQSLW